MSIHHKLSHLTLGQAKKILGAHALHLLNQGNAFEIDPENDIDISEHLFRLRLADATVTLIEDPKMTERVRAICSCKEPTCAHLAGFLSFILEEKQSLGLAIAPPENDTPLFDLSDEELELAELHRRMERAQTERIKLQVLQPKKLWSDYIVSNGESGRTYRVALRGWKPGESYCSCPDFRKNTLGVCKHVLFVMTKVRELFPQWKRMAAFVPTRAAVSLGYGKEITLKVQLPPDASSLLRKHLGSFEKTAEPNPTTLLQAISLCTAAGENVVIFPDAQRYLELAIHRDSMAQLVGDIRANPQEHPLRKSLLKVELLPYQLDGIAFVAGQGRAVLADDMGLGKTIQGVGVAELLAREHGISKVLVVVPASVKGQWMSEIHKFCHRSATIVGGASKERGEQYRSGAFFTICNYEQVMRDLKDIEVIHWDLIILDEGQRIKNWEAQTTRAIKALQSRFALVLSGTPLENKLEELHSVVEFIDDRRLGPDYLFRHRHVITQGPTRKTGYRNLAQLRELLKPLLLRRTRAMVLKQLPPRTTEIVRITPTEEQLEIHSANARMINTIIRKPVLTEMDLLRLQKAMLLCRMSADSTTLVDKVSPGHSTKLERLAEMLPRLAAETDRKIIVFSEWTGMLDLIEKQILGPAKLQWVRLDGSVQQKKRPTLVRKFQEDPACTFFLSSNAGSTGLNLQAANTVVNVDLPWNPAILEQRIGRAHRMGQKRPVQVYLMVTTDTLEEGMLDTLGTKSELSHAAIDFESDITSVHLKRSSDDLKARLERLLQKPEAPVDESLARRVQAEAQAQLDPVRALAIADATGQLMLATTALLGQMLPATPAIDDTMRQQMRESLLAGAVRNADGTLSLAMRMPNEQALQNLADGLALLMGIKSK